MVQNSLIVNSKHGSPVTFRLSISFDPGDSHSVNAYLWTNYEAETPNNFIAKPMRRIANSGNVMIFDIELPSKLKGTFTATAYIESLGQKVWVNDDIFWRNPVKEIENLYIKQVPIDKVNARIDSDEISTISDMMSDSELSYTLHQLQNQGINCIWIQTPYRIDPWEYRHEVDTAGSDYASTDWLSIDPEISMNAREIPEWDKNLRHTAANNEMKDFVKKAQKLGMKVLFGIAPNHVGHNYIFRDFFVDDRTVKSRDYSQIVTDSSRLSETQNRISHHSGTAIADYAEYIYPKMYATKDKSGRIDPSGANDVSETYYPNYYGAWPDTKHLNHGAHAGQKIWNASTKENQKVLEYIGRVMLWAVTELGIDGFRIDHCVGMPFEFFTQTIPWVEMKAKELRSGFNGLILLNEDHDRKQFTTNVGDIVQSTWYMELLKGFGQKNASRIWNVYNHPQFYELSGTGNHDEHRGIEVFMKASYDHDIRRYGNAFITMLFMGGPFSSLAGDEFGEQKKLHFKGKGGIPTLWQIRNKKLPVKNLELCYWISQAGILRKKEKALQSSNRENLSDSSSNTMILGFEKSNNKKSLLVFSNLDSQLQEGTFQLGKQTKEWLKNEKISFLQVRDLYALTPNRPLWRSPIHKDELLKQGIFVSLSPYQVNVLELYSV